MVNTLFSSARGLARCVAACGLLMLAGCKTPNPVDVDASFVTTPEFSTRSPSILSLLPIEDGTADHEVARHLHFMRQEINRQLPDRLYAPTRQTWVDASLRGAAPAGESILTPATLATLARSSKDDAVLAVRVAEWDESRLMSRRKVHFRFEAAMVAGDGTPLWSGSIQGEVKAGGAGAAPLGRDASARSCVELAVHELLLRLPGRVV
ncbi:MAG: hypothetical protein KAI24_08065, partial [Planctomycetes bacterium]|nr:hypothetical protein [Planctomycetota bacterium]